ncbi:nucleotide pyrophosphohydrolase [Desulfosporosinus sp. BG]|uniref:nucleotide pyrophosphohydrolase n=1 Tax=Desulfosporosinus sp. BG TaxID=1633135 RepID=UPI00083A3033|nr:nucleotide pyrophosphohydrolase [Desulfosporosinus sp. BG]ODA41864.1 putative Cytosolic Protein [Desulfosporosinus sp. BG]
MKPETINKVLKFRDDRNWKQFHNPKDLAISINLEAAELLEIFQWSGKDLECNSKIEKVREESADILNYCILFADAYQLDLDEIVTEKINRNEKKYPVEKAFGNKTKYTQLKEESGK